MRRIFRQIQGIQVSAPFTGEALLLAQEGAHRRITDIQGKPAHRFPDFIRQPVFEDRLQATLKPTEHAFGFEMTPDNPCRIPGLNLGVRHRFTHP